MQFRARYEDGSIKIVEASDMYNAYLMCCTDCLEDKPSLVELVRVGQTKEEVERS